MEMGKNKIIFYLSETSTSLIFFYLFIFCLPFFRRLEFLTPYSFFGGKFIDYLTYSIYGFDFLLVTALCLWVVEIILGRKKVMPGSMGVVFSWFLVIIFSFISLFFAESLSIGLYYILILLTLFVVYLFIVNKIRSHRDFFVLLNFFILSVLFQSFVAIVQFIKNKSVGLYSLGEQIISPQIDGVAKTIIDNEKHIRPYGTFSHPNVLALFLLVGGLVALYLLFNSKNKKYRIYLIFIITIISIALVLTFSRVAWIAAVIFWGAYVFRKLKVKSEKLKVQFKIKSLKKYFPYFLIILLPLLLIIYLAPSIWTRVDPTLSTTWESLNVRGVVFLKSWFLIKNHLLGIGIGNFIIGIAYLLADYPVWLIEPVHNTFVLILTEIGIAGLFSFILFLYFIFKKIKKAPLFLGYIFGMLVFLMFFDHYFWDLRQAQFLMIVFLGLVAASSLFDTKKT